jgi:hypothetical protein
VIGWSRRCVIAVALLLLLALPTAQLPAIGFVYFDLCCCGDAGPCPCPEQPHDDGPTMRPCGSGGDIVTSPGFPSFDLPQIEIIEIAERIAPPAATYPLPHAAPDDEPPTVPI